MTKQELQSAFTIANDSSVDLSEVDNSNHDGFGLREFKPVHTTLRAVAKTIRWQAQQLNGDWDAKALDEVASYGRRVFQIFG
jgi:hypothetical protein